MHYGRLVGALSTNISATSTGATSNNSYILTAIKDCELYRVTHNQIIQLLIDAKQLRYIFICKYVQTKFLEKINIKTDKKITEVKSVGISELAMNHFMAL